jgi:hypothetical protein
MPTYGSAFATAQTAGYCQHVVTTMLPGRIAVYGFLMTGQ